MVGIGDDDEKLCRFDTQQGDRCHILSLGTWEVLPIGTRMRGKENLFLMSD